MLKKLILAIATFAIIAIAFAVVQWQENLARPNRSAQTRELPTREEPKRSTSTTQPQQTSDIQALSMGQATIPPGEAPRMRIYDREGNAKIIFGAESWRPISDTEFDLTKPKARLLLPRGQLAYIQADSGQVQMRKGDSSTELNPKHGKFEGHVSIIIDRTDVEWRKNHPDQAEPEQHPEKVIKIWLEDAEFDLDFNWLKSSGTVIVQSKEGTLEGTGLTLRWDEVDRQVREVTIHEGKRARLRLAGLMNFQSDEQDAKSEAQAEGEASKGTDDSMAEPEYPFLLSEYEQQEQDAVDDADEVDEETRNLLEMAQMKEEKPPSIKTYKISFHEKVVAEHVKGVQVIKRLSADLLQLTRNFSSAELNPGGIRKSPPEAAEQSAATQETPVEEKAQAHLPGAQDQHLEVTWSGPLTINPIGSKKDAKQSTVDQKKDDSKQKKIDNQKLVLLATGSPVKLFDRQKGSARCQKLEYHEKGQQVWLRGTPEKPVVMQRGKGRELVGENFWLDSQQGKVRITGQGYLIDRGEQNGQQSQATSTTSTIAVARAGTDDQVKISWEQSIELEFEQGQAETDQEAGNLTEISAIPQVTRVRRAVVKGEPAFESGTQSITATDFIDVTFPPQVKLESVENVDQVVADKIIAQGQVRMTDGHDYIFCDRLEADMTVNAAGANVPQQGRAFGNARVNLANAGGRIKMKADDQLIATFKSILKEDKNTQDMSAPSENRWGVAISDLQASGAVRVESLEDKLVGMNKELDLRADKLECSFSEDNRIKKALVYGEEKQPAEVDTGDFFIRGKRIRLDVPAESAEVPGAGELRLYSRRDLDGRPVNEPIPVTISWQNRMDLNGRENIATFNGSAHAVSQNITADCDELQVEFAELPPASPQALAAETPIGQQLALATSSIAANLPGTLTLSKPGSLPGLWAMGQTAASLFGAASRADDNGQATRVATRIRKRPVYIKAVGNAKVVSRNRKESEVEQKGGAVSRFFEDTLARKSSTTRPGTGQQTENLVRVTGPIIAVNLHRMEEYFMVEGPGNLLIVDNRIPTRKRQQRRSPDAENPLGSVAFGMSGPSQTLFKWQNSMTYLNNHNTAVFDHQVNMIHRSGKEIALLDKILASTDLEREQFKGMDSHKVDLDCENFYVKFSTEDQADRGGPTPLSQVSMLNSFRAVGRVRLQLDNRHAEGESIFYDNTRSVALLTGSPQNPPQIMQHDPDTGRVIPWTGKSLQWNLETKKIRVLESSMQATAD